MKKNLKKITLFLFVLLLLTGCGSDSKADKDKSTAANKDSDKVEENNDKKEPEIPKNESIAFKQTVTLTNGEFFVEYAKFAKKVTPPKASGYYSYYEADSGKTYLDVSISYKNLATVDAEADEIVKATLKYKDEYTYDGFTTIEEDNRSDFTYTNITDISPLTTEYIHYLFEVPEGVSSDDGKIVVTLTFEGKSFDILVRDGNTGSVSDSNDNDSSVVTDKVVKTKEKVNVSGIAEFYVEKANITKKVTPPKASGYYSYYEADSGKVYVDVIFSYKNLESDDVEADEVIGAKLIYNSKYEYTGFTTIEEDNRSDFTYTNITDISPLTTEYIHYLFEVPQAVQKGSEPIVVNFTIGDNSYIYVVR